MFEPKLRWLTYMSCHDIYSQENISRIDCARMDRPIQMIIFAAFGLLLNFVFQSQQNNAAFLVLLMHYQQAFQRLVSVIRGRRVRLNRRRLRNRPWSWTFVLPPSLRYWIGAGSRIQGRSHRHFEKTAAGIPRFHYKNHRKKDQMDREKIILSRHRTC